MLVICYGVPRSASSYAFQLVRAAVSQHAACLGSPLLDPSEFSRAPGFYIKDADALSDVVREAPSQIREGRAFCVVKTHAARTDPAETFRRPWLRVVASRRAPEACVRSLIETYRDQTRVYGVSEHPAGESVERACAAILRQLGHLRSWEAVPHLPIEFETLVADPESFVRSASAFCGLDAGPRSVVASVGTIWQKREVKIARLSAAEHHEVHVRLATAEA